MAPACHSRAQESGILWSRPCHGITSMLSWGPPPLRMIHPHCRWSLRQSRWTVLGATKLQRPTFDQTRGSKHSPSSGMCCGFLKEFLWNYPSHVCWNNRKFTTERDIMVAPPGILADATLDVSLASPRKGPPKGHRHSLTVHGATCGQAKPLNMCLFSTKASPQSFHPFLLLH